MAITIDGVSVINITIDNTPVTEVTIDGIVVFTSAISRTYYTDLLFNMTSNTTPAPYQMIDISNENNGAAYQGFNNVSSNWWQPRTGTSGSATLDLASTHIINALHLEVMHSSSKNSDVTWIIEGSEDNTNFAQIGTQIITNADKGTWQNIDIELGSAEENGILTRYLRISWSATERSDVSLRVCTCNSYWK